jgi:hypothetical protein
LTGRRVLAAALAVVWLAALILVVKMGLDRLSAPPWGNAAAGDLSPEVAGSTQVGQAWRAPLPGLYRIEVSVQPPPTGTGQPVTFHLRTGLDATSDLWTATIDPVQIAAGAPYAFEFEPVRDSKARTFYFYLESPESGPGEAIQAVYGPASVLDGGSAYVNGQEVGGNLVFQTYYSLRTRDKIDLLLERMAQGRPYALGTKGFYVALAVLYILLLLLLIWQVGRRVASEEK